MADNIELEAGSGGAVVKTDEDGSSWHWQYMKMAFGADGTQTRVTASVGLPVSLLAGSASIGAVTNAGTFAVQEDGAALTALQIIDDWDESDRAKVNPIAGQAGVAAGAGVVGVTVQRTTLASDDPAVAFLGTIDTDTSSMNTDLGTLAGAVAAGQMQVDIVADGAGLALAANQLADGHNVTVDNASIAITHAALTELAAAINTNELDVNIASDSVGIAGGTQYTEDAAAAADPVGNAQILVRDDAPVSIAADGDNVARRGTEYGAAYTQIVDSSGNFIDSFGGSGGTSSADDADFVAGTTLGTIAQGVYESSPTSVTDGDVGAIGITATRELKVDITSNTAGVGGGTAYTEDVATANPIVGTATMMERDDALSAVTPIEGDWIGLRGSAEGALWTQDFNSDAILSDTSSIDGKITACNTGAVVISSGTVTAVTDITNTVTVDNGGTFATQATLQANSGVDIGDVDVTSVPRSIMGPSEPGAAVDSYTQAAINLTTGANQVLVSSAASKQIWVYGYMFTCGDADGQTVSFQDEDDTALSGVMEFAQYGGASVSPSGNFSMPIWKLGTDKDLEIDITGGDVDGWIAYAILSI